MSNLEKYHGVFPAFYACYDDDGNISPERCAQLTEYMIGKGVQGLYVNGSSGECIYLSVEERKTILESVMKAAKSRLVVIAHVACNNTKDSMELARHAESLGVDAIAAIPPIYFRLPPYAIEKYWNDISSAAPDTDFVIYNIPQLAGVSLDVQLFRKMRENPRVIGVKNSSMPTQDIQMFKAEGGDDFVIFNGPDEQYISGRAIGASGGIGATYGVMPELFLEMERAFVNGETERAQKLQYRINEIIYAMIECRGNLYAVMKEILKADGLFLGGVRAPLYNVTEKDLPMIERCRDMIRKAVCEFCGRGYKQGETEND